MPEVLTELDRELHIARDTEDWEWVSHVACAMKIYARGQERIAERKLMKIRPGKMEPFWAWVFGALGGIMIQGLLWFQIMITTNLEWTSVGNEVISYTGLAVGWIAAASFLALGFLLGLRVVYSYHPSHNLRKIVETTAPIIETTPKNFLQRIFGAT